MRMTQLKTASVVVGVGLAGLATFPLVTHAVTPDARTLPPALVRPVVPQAPPTTSAKTPREVETTVYLVEVRASALAQATQGGTPGHRPNDTLLESLRKAGAVITSVPTIRTLEDMPGKMTQTAQASAGAALNGPLQKNNASMVTSVETKPHVNADGSLTITLTVSESEAGPRRSAPNTASRVSTTRTLKSGETVILGGTSSSSVQRSSGTTAPSEPLAHIILLTATLVPDEHGTQTTPAPAT